MRGKEMKYRLVSIDIDGTLLNDQRKIAPRTASAIARAVDMGMAVCLATGRRWNSTVDYVRQLKLQTPTICFHGGVVVDSITGQALHSEMLDMTLARSIIAAWIDFGVPVFVYRHSLEMPDVIHQHHDSDHPRVRDFLDHEGGNVAVVDDLLASLDWQPMRLMTYGYPRHVEACYQQFANLYTEEVQVYLTPHQDTAYLEVLPAGASKAQGLDWLSRHLGVSPGQAIAFGDNLNDLDMLRWAGLGVAMGNAGRHVKEAADIVTADNDSDGIAMVLEEVLGVED